MFNKIFSVMSRANDHPTFHPYSLPPTFIGAILEYLSVIAHAAAGSHTVIYELIGNCLSCNAVTHSDSDLE